MTLIERIKDGYVLGLVFYKSTLMMYMAPPAWFVMDYARYDPSITTSDERSSKFRDGVLLVDDSTALAYLKSMQPDAISIDELQAELPNYKDSLQPIFLIDFDNHRYVSWYFDVDYEEYIPSGWEGVFENPFAYLPNEVKAIWEQPGPRA
jgi:hypothetical protein